MNRTTTGAPVPEITGKEVDPPPPARFLLLERPGRSHVFGWRSTWGSSAFQDPGSLVEPCTPRRLPLLPRLLGPCWGPRSVLVSRCPSPSAPPTGPSGDTYRCVGELWLRRRPVGAVLWSSASFHVPLAHYSCRLQRCVETDTRAVPGGCPSDSPRGAFSLWGTGDPSRDKGEFHPLSDRCVCPYPGLRRSPRTLVRRYTCTLFTNVLGLPCRAGCTGG